MLPAQVVYDLANILQLSDKAFIVGGQALNLWAERYSRVAQLAAYGPYTSKDIDYFGYEQAAEKLAKALGGKVLYPKADDHTPQTAVVRATVAGQELEIDFLWNVLGVDPDFLQRQAVEMRLTVRIGEGNGELRIPIMHPLHCLQSRLANVVDLHRDTDLARRQLEASPIVLREYLSERLSEEKGHRHVTGVLQVLYDYLLTHPSGRKAHKVMQNDPAMIFDHFRNDERLDPRWRDLSLASMCATIAERRTAWGAMKARLGRLMGKDEKIPD